MAWQASEAVPAPPPPQTTTASEASTLIQLRAWPSPVGISTSRELQAEAPVSGSTPTTRCPSTAAAPRLTAAITPQSRPPESTTHPRWARALPKASAEAIASAVASSPAPITPTTGRRPCSTPDLAMPPPCCVSTMARARGAGNRAGHVRGALAKMMGRGPGPTAWQIHNREIRAHHKLR